LRIAQPPKNEYTDDILNFDAHFLANGQSLEVDQYKADDGTMYHITFDQALVSPFRTYNLVRSYEAAVSFNFGVRWGRNTRRSSYGHWILFSMNATFRQPANYLAMMTRMLLRQLGNGFEGGSYGGGGDYLRILGS